MTLPFAGVSTERPAVVAKYSSDDFKPPESSDDAAHRPEGKR